MKAKYLILITGLLYFLLFKYNFQLIAQNAAKHNYTTYKGVVIDSETEKPLLFSNITINGTNIATVSNSEGEFIIKVPNEFLSKSIDFSYLGYNTVSVPIEELKADENLIKVNPTTIPLSEINIRPDDPLNLVRSALYKIPKNYSDKANMMTAFYRESVMKRNQYVSISEAVLELYKAPYNNAIKRDLVKIFKGRKSSDVKKMDTILFKVQGGPSSTLMLDITKNPQAILSEEYFEDYHYTLEGLLKIDDRLTYVIRFQQKRNIDYPLYYGKLYIDMETLAISAADFNLNLHDRVAASKLFIKRKPLKMSLLPLRASYYVSYKENNEKWYFNYARCDVKFRCKWKTKLFNTTYSTLTEMAVTDRTDQNVERFSLRDRLQFNEILNERVQFYTDEDYWGEYNTIEPEESIEKAIEKLGQKAVSSIN